MAPQVFVGRSSIDLRRVHTGAWGRSVTWAPRPPTLRRAASTWTTSSAAAGDGGGFGFDQNSSPDLCAFGYAEVEAARDEPALMLVGSSGTMRVTVNEQSVYQSDNPAGRGYSPDTDTVRLTLTRGRNRILVVSRQGIGPWCFSVQIAGLSSSSIASRSAPGAALEPSRSRPQMIVAGARFPAGFALDSAGYRSHQIFKPGQDIPVVAGGVEIARLDVADLLR